MHGAGKQFRRKDNGGTRTKKHTHTHMQWRCTETNQHMLQRIIAHTINLLHNEVKWIDNDRFVFSTKDGAFEILSNASAGNGHQLVDSWRWTLPTANHCKDRKSRQGLEDVHIETNVKCVHTAKTERALLPTIHAHRRSWNSPVGEREKRDRDREVRLWFKPAS